MTIAFQCVSCQHLIRVADQNAGKRGKCPKCSTPMTVPMTAEPVVLVAPVVQPAADPNNPFANFASDGDEPVIRPRYRRRRSKLKLFLGLLIFFGLLGGGGYFAYRYFFANAGLSEEERYFPDGVQVVASVRVDDFLGSETWKAVKKEFKEVADELEKKDSANQHLKLSDIDRMTVAASLKGDFVLLVRGKKDFKTADIVAEAKKSFKAADIKVKESTVGGHTLYVPEQGQAFAVVNSRLIVQGKGDTLETVLKRGKKPEFTTDFEKVYKEADFSKTLAVAVHVGDLVAAAKKGGANTLPIPPGLLPPEMPSLPLEMLGGVDGVAIDVKVGADVSGKATLLCKDAKTADELSKLADGGLTALKKQMKEQAPKEMLEVLDGVKVSASGKNVSATVTIKVGPVLKSFKDLKQK